MRLGAWKRHLWLSVVVLAVTASVVVAASAEERPVDGPVAPPGEGVAQVQSIESDAKDAAAVLEGHREATDVMPTEVAESIDGEPSFGMNPDLSRLAIGNTSSSLYLVPAREHVCVAFTFTVGERASMTCPSTETLAAGKAGPMTVLLAGNIVGVLGIVPDGIDSVTLMTSAGTAAVPVENNAYYNAVPAGVDIGTLSYQGPTGPVEFELTSPVEALRTATR